jgi:CBS domain-containing protein
MSEAVSILLEQARAHRAQAERAKRLAGDITTRDVARSLSDYAEALERLAVAAEERAFALIEATAKTPTGSTGREGRIAATSAPIPRGERPATPPATTNAAAADGGE